MELKLFEIDELVNEVSMIMEDNLKDILLKYRKFATKKTYSSVRSEDDTTENRAVIRLLALESLRFIVSGRRPGAKLPVRKTGDGFELVPELKEWVKAVGFTGHYFLLARSIARKGVKGVPIVELMIEKSRPQIMDAIRRRTVDNARGVIIKDLRLSFKNI